MVYLFKTLSTKWWLDIVELRKRIVEQGLDLTNQSFSSIVEEDPNIFDRLRNHPDYDPVSFKVLKCERQQGDGWRSYLFISKNMDKSSAIDRQYHYILQVADDALAIQIKLACF